MIPNPMDPKNHARVLTATHVHHLVCPARCRLVPSLLSRPTSMDVTPDSDLHIMRHHPAQTPMKTYTAIAARVLRISLR